MILARLGSNPARELIYPNKMRSDSLAEVRENRERLSAFIAEEAQLLSLLGEPRSAVMDAAKGMESSWRPNHFTAARSSAAPERSP